MGGFSIWHWLIVLLVVVLLFGTKKLRTLGTDLGAGIKSFRKGLQEGDETPGKIESDPDKPASTREQDVRDRSD